MIKDGRSGKVMVISHCIINMNAAADGSSTPSLYPAIVNEIVDLLRKYQTGIIQLPCPELEIYGLDRIGREKGFYDNQHFRNFCMELARKTVDRIEEYQKNEYEVVGFIGRSGSPSCSVNGETGVFVEELGRELRNRSVNLEMIDFDSKKIAETVERLKRLLH